MSEPTAEEVAAIMAERPSHHAAPKPIPVRARFYLTECEHCGWVGSSEQCGTDSGGDDSDVYCPVCRLSTACRAPNGAGTAAHGQRVFDRIVTAERLLAKRDAELAEARAENERLRLRQSELEAICNALRAALATREAEVNAMRRALREMVYETTHLSPLEDDGSHWCKISKDCLAAARAALTNRTEGGDA